VWFSKYFSSQNKGVGVGPTKEGVIANLKNQYINVILKINDNRNHHHNLFLGFFLPTNGFSTRKLLLQ
jgi:hypothetical protein